ncbi:MAG TPA: LLM class flavin-dependent oxidoreductase [Chloroflexota bacterium]|nr:LLM class flavin-dependent oxidoreductase [Chloroflexota bacterium]
MRIGYHLTPFWSPTDRSPTLIMDEAIEVIAASANMGFDWVSMGQHWMSHPSVWPQPYPFLARIAPVTGEMKLKTSVLLLPLLNSVDVAENLATLDHISHGRLVVGVAIGYREDELAAIGLTRRDRVPKLEESIELMKRLWTGEEVTFSGAYSSVQNGKMGFRPYQQPHPPLEMGAQSRGATERAARLTDGVFFGPQVAWTDIAALADVYRTARLAAGRPGLGALGASRCLMVGTSKEDAAARAGAYLEKTFRMYTRWQMQESSMVPLQLDAQLSLADWTIYGSPADCVETILRARDEIGLNGIGFTIYSLPADPQGRIEYLQMVAEEIVAKVSRPEPIYGQSLGHMPNNKLR